MKKVATISEYIATGDPATSPFTGKKVFEVCIGIGFVWQYLTRAEAEGAVERHAKYVNRKGNRPAFFGAGNR